MRTLLQAGGLRPSRGAQGVIPWRIRERHAMARELSESHTITTPSECAKRPLGTARSALPWHEC